MYASDTERLRAFVRALDTREWSRAFVLGQQLSGLCDRDGVLSQYCELRPLIEATQHLVTLCAIGAHEAHRAELAHAALAHLLEGIGQDDAPRARAIAAARSSLALLDAARADAPGSKLRRAVDAVGRGYELARRLGPRPCAACGSLDPGNTCPVCEPDGDDKP